MSEQHSAAGAAITELVLKIFHINGLLLAAGDQLSKDLGLTSARWQVMGALANGPLTAAQIARNMGLRRQSVQRLIDILAEQGILMFEDNPDHRRAKLVRLTKTGQKKYRKINQIQIQWANTISQHLSAKKINEATALLNAIEKQLQQD